MTGVLDWLRGHRERRGKRALAARLRRELVDDEARLSDAVERLEAATTEESNAGLAVLGRELNADADPRGLEAARKRLEYANKARQLAGYAFAVDRARLNITSGALHALERQLAESE